MKTQKQNALNNHLPSHDLPLARLHQCGKPDVELKPLVSHQGSTHPIFPIYIKDKCGGETIIEIHLSDYVRLAIFHACTNHLDTNKVNGVATQQTSQLHPHADAIMARLAK
mgnify:FL=1